MNVLETRLQGRVDRREVIHGKQEALLAERGADGELSDTDKSQIDVYRSELVELDSEIDSLAADLEAHNKAAEVSKSVRRAMLGASDDIDGDGDGVVYRTMAAYARDVILSRESTISRKIAGQVGDNTLVEAARSRLQLLQRTPANTLSSNVGGLQPPQFIDQIFQVINKSRPIVDSAERTTLERGTLTYPAVTQRPLVAVQAAEKTEAGNQGMVVGMLTTQASTYLGGGDLSWQAINWSTPNALQLWFNLAAASYALLTEQDAATVLRDSGFTHDIGSPIGSTPTFADFLTAVGAGYSAVFANSGRVANTIYMAPDRYGYLLGLTSAAFSQFVNVAGDAIGTLNVVVSRGMDAGEIIVGDSAGLLVAETDGAPVELNVVEPAIGGVEVGIIGAFEAVVVDPGAFSTITTAS